MTRGAQPYRKKHYDLRRRALRKRFDPYEDSVIFEKPLRLSREENVQFLKTLEREVRVGK
jgi:hypothetical protein